ncbi:hypothetical protein F5Y06DRAFT_188705 [Hypoxylon sp. FL0890]|nr:hypothetical protein F5Y06DRAFT_188705 [Hypoxylon sp. FL0890]
MSPRKDKYSKLLCRFYEPLILLAALGKTRGTHTSSPQDTSTTQSKRRRLLRNLSYLCDCEKGGETTSSIGLEENDQCFIFWVASNATRPRARLKIVKFLQRSLEQIEVIIVSQEQGPRSKEALKEEFIIKCIEFVEPRVKKEIKLLSKAIEKCEKHLDSAKLGQDSRLNVWLSQFSQEGRRSRADLCFQAYNQRKAPEMSWLEDKINTGNEDTGLDSQTLSFSSVRHYLGRLAAHVRRPKEVIEDSIALGHLFDEYEIRLVELRPSSKRPEADSLTELHSILGRMLPAGEPKLDEYKEALTSLDQKFNIAIRVRHTYTDKNFQPRIHAEIQILDHFYANRLSFAGNDSYIGCSKPACYCCHLYFQHHPSSPVVPESHQNIYLNWGLPDLPRGTEDPGYIPQRDLLNKMVNRIRQDALEQIRQKAGPLKWHADSLTEFTERAMAVPSTMKHPGESSLSRQLAKFHKDSALDRDASNMGSQVQVLEEASESSSEETTYSTRERLGESTLDFDSDMDSEGGVVL